MAYYGPSSFLRFRLGHAKKNEGNIQPFWLNKLGQ